MKTINFKMVLGLIVSITMFLQGCAEQEINDFETTASLKTTYTWSQDDCGNLLTTPLIAGQYTQVGIVEVYIEDDMIKARYAATYPYVIGEYHLAIEDFLIDIPQNNKNNPKIGHFEFSDTYDEYVDQIIVEGPTISEMGNTVVVAAHAVIYNLMENEFDPEVFQQTLPESLETFVTNPWDNGAYAQIEVKNSGSFNGIYPGFCIDRSSRVTLNSTVIRNIASSYNEDLSCYIKFPENMDLVNYLINQDYTEWGATFKELQAAIWILADNPELLPPAGGITWDVDIVNAIVEDARENGEDFVPTCSGKIAIILHNGCWEESNEQVLILIMNYNCDLGSETAWGGGYDFGGKSWAMAFDFCVY